MHIYPYCITIQMTAAQIPSAETHA